MKRYSDSVADNTLLVSQNVTNLMNDIRAEDLLNDAVYYIDARDASASGQTIDNLGTAKELLPTTLGSSTSADSNDPKFLDHTGTNYVYLPGTSGNYLTIPDANNLDITGDIDLRFYGAPDAWTASGFDQALISKSGTGNSRSYWMWLPSSGSASTLKPVFEWTTDGIYANRLSAISTANIPFTAGQPGWIRVTLDVDNGAGGKDVKFFTSTDGTTWTQLGSTVTTAGTTSIFAGTDQVEIGSRASTATLYVGKVFRAQIFNGIDGTKVLDVDTSVLKTGAETSFTALTGQTVTINRSTSGRKTVAVTQPCWLFGTDDYMEVNNRYMSSGTYLYLPGVSGNYVSSPDSAALDITGDIDIRAKAAMDDWTPSADMNFISKMNGGYSYRLNLLGSGRLQLGFSTDGTNFFTGDSSVATGVTDGAIKWVRATRTASTGVITFYLSDDGTNWTELGTTVNPGSGNIHNGTGTLEIGSWAGGNANAARGKFFRAMVFNGINGTKVFDADFENKITSLEQASFVESSSNAATVTINRSGSTYRSAGITTAGYLYPGATNTFSASATDLLNFGASDSFTTLFVARQWPTQGNFSRYLEKSDVSAAPGYSLQNNGTAATLFPSISDGVNSANRAGLTALTAGSLISFGHIVNRSNQTLVSYGNSSISTSVSISGVSSSATVYPLRIAARSSATVGNYSDIEFVGAAVFRRALTSAEITLITNYFNRRSL